MKLSQQCICKECRKEFDRPETGRPPKFCSDACKMRDYRRNKKLSNVTKQVDPVLVFRRFRNVQSSKLIASIPELQAEYCYLMGARSVAKASGDLGLVAALDTRLTSILEQG